MTMRLILPTQHIVLVEAGADFLVRPEGPNHDVATEFDIWRCANQTRAADVPVVGVKAFVVRIQINGDDVGVAPRITKNMVVRADAGVLVRNHSGVKE